MPAHEARVADREGGHASQQAQPNDGDEEDVGVIVIVIRGRVLAVFHVAIEVRFSSRGKGNACGGRRYGW